MQQQIQNEVKQGLVIFALLVLFSIITSFPFPIKPNIYLVGIVLFAFSIHEPLLFGAFVLGTVGLAKYMPAATPELVVLGISGVALFIVRKMFIREAQPLLMGIGVLILQAVFWIFFAPHQSFGLPFLMEFFYNVLILIVVIVVLRMFKKDSKFI